MVKTDLETRIMESFGPTKEHPNGRRIVFWEDETRGSLNKVDELSLNGITIFKLDGFNGFRCKYVIEKQNPDSRFLIYMPYKYDGDTDEILADTIHYSQPFFKAEVHAYIASDLGIPPVNAHLVRDYSFFFSSKVRIKQFQDMEPNPDDGDEIVRAIMACIVKSKALDSQSIIMHVLSNFSDSLNGSDFVDLDNLDKYGIQDRFWKVCLDELGISSNTMGDFVRSIFVTYLSTYVDLSPHPKLKPYIVSKSRHVSAFVNKMFASGYSSSADILSTWVSDQLKIPDLLKTHNITELSRSDAFPCIDEIILEVLTKRILEDHKPLNDDDFSIIEYRRTKHFYHRFENEYVTLANSNGLLKLIDIFDRTLEFAVMPQDVVKNYAERWYAIDTSYRHFTFSYNRMKEASTDMESLRTFIEDIYNYHYLNLLIKQFFLNMSPKYIPGPPQNNFYHKHIKESNQATVVIISDAFRYECAAELADRLVSSPRVRDAPDLKYMITNVPSITKFGMAALLPNSGLEVIFKDNISAVFIDGMDTSNLKSREAVLQHADENSVAVHSHDVINMNVADLRSKCAGKNVVYIYQNLIDQCGESSSTEYKVFQECENAIVEIIKLINLITNRLSYTRFIITADHGFIYRRRDLLETDKIRITPNAEYDSRCIISNTPICGEESFEIKFEQPDSECGEFYVDVPFSFKIYSAPGTQHYVHGGMSPQEMIVPVLEVFTKKGLAIEEYVSLKAINKRIIRQYKAHLSFAQDRPVDDSYVKAKYELWFTDKDNNRVSDTQFIIADRESGQDMEFRVQFNFTIDKGHIILNIRNTEKENMPIIQEEYDISVAFTDLGGL